ncbi:MAG: formylglycine-generating enzyme family protein [Nibricoccus sp.]
MKNSVRSAGWLFLIVLTLALRGQTGEAEKAALQSPLPATQTLDLGDGVTMNFALIPRGTFWMGSNEEAGDGDESPEHKVGISQPFYLGTCEVTQAQWEKIMGANPSRFRGELLPVDTVSWNDAQRFLAALSKKTGRTCMLPTEAQWEYACRAGTRAPWSFGAQPGAAADFAWGAENAEGATHPVGLKKPNPWGLHDMHGNVWEWCADWYEKHTYSKTADVDPKGPVSGDGRILRGGAWGDEPDGMRSAVRNCNGPDGANHGIGLRVLLIATSPGSSEVH